VFTGIIEATATISKRTKTSLVVARPRGFDDVKLGASIAVAGVCLTVTKMTKDAFTFDVVPETWSKSTLGKKKEGDYVNLERAIPAMGRLDGHVVQGHVEGTATVTHTAVAGEGRELTVTLPRDLLPMVAQKGSIALDGVSLTVARLSDDACTVALVPATVLHTTLGDLGEGDAVNVETDILARTVARLLFFQRP